MSADIATLGLAVDATQVARARTELGAFVGAVGQAEAATLAMTRQVETMVGPLKNVYATIGVVAGAMASWKMTQYANDAAQLAARIETLDVVLKAVGNSSGYTEAQMRTAAESVRRMGITMQESRETVTRMAQSQLDLSKAAQLARVAQDAAVIGNINSSEALERMVFGIQSAQVETLRTIGINVSWEQSYNKMAAQLGRSVDSMSEAEKAIARQNAVLEAGKNIAGAYAGAMDTAGKMLSSTSRFIEDATANIGKAFLPAYTDGVRTYYTALKVVNDNLNRLADDGTIDAVGKGIQSVAAHAGDAAAALVILGAGRYLAPLAKQAAETTTSYVALRTAVADGNAAYIDGARGALARAAAEREAAAAAATDAAATLARVKADQDAIATSLARAQAERARTVAQAELQAGIAAATGAEAGHDKALKAKNDNLRTILNLQRTYGALTAEAAGAQDALAAAQNRATAASAAHAAAIQAVSLRAQLASATMKAWQDVLAFFGGPIGMAITAVGVAVYALASQQSAAEKAANDHADALRKIKGEADKAAPSIDKVTESLVRQQRARAEQKVTTASENMAAIQRELGGAGWFGLAGDQAKYGTGAAAEILDLKNALNSGRVDVEQFGLAMDELAAKNPDLRGLAASVREQVDAWKAAREEGGSYRKQLDALVGSSDAANAALARGRIASQGFEDGLNNLLKASGLAIKDGHLMSQGLAEVAGYEQTVTQITDALSGKFKVNGEAVTFTADQLERLRAITPQVGEALRQLKERQDPVTQSMRAMADQARLLEVPAGIMRDRAKAIQDAERASVVALPDTQRTQLVAGVDNVAVATLKDHNRELEQRAQLEKLVASAAGGSAATQAQAARTVELYNQALKTYGTDVAAAVLAGKPLPADLQATADALKAVDLAKFGGEATRAATGLRMQAEAQQGVADAALVSADAMKRAEIHARAVDTAFRTGAGSVEAWEQALLAVHEAEQKTAQNDYARQIDRQIAANHNLTLAYKDGSLAAIVYAERENEIQELMDRLGMTYKEAGERVDRFNNSRKSSQSEAQIAQLREELDVTDRLALARRKGEEAYRRQQAIEEASRVIRQRYIVDEDEQERLRQRYVSNASATTGYEAEARVLSELHGHRDQARMDMAAINRLYQDGAISAEEFEVAQRQAMMRGLESSRVFVDGAHSALLRYTDDVSNAAAAAYEFTTRSLRGLEDNLTGVLTGTKTSFQDFAKIIEEGVARMVVQLLIMAPLLQSITAMLQSLGLGGGIGMGSVNVGIGGVGGGGGGMGGALGGLGSAAGGMASMGMMSGGGGIGGMWDSFTRWMAGNSGAQVYGNIGDVGPYLSQAGSGVMSIGAEGPTMFLGAESEMMDFAAMLPFAKGGIFDNVHAFAKGSAFTNTVVDSPTLFKFANGAKMGVMGEAGPEAILPLSRGSDGSLGVRVAGGSPQQGGGDIHVEIINQTTGRVDNTKTERSVGPDGKRILRIFIQEEVKRMHRTGELDSTMAANHGVGRRPVQRG